MALFHILYAAPMRSMTDISALVAELRATWGTPTAAFHRGDPCPFLLQCKFSEPPPIGMGGELIGLPKSNDMRQFWTLARNALLFRDVEYGQWGLQVLSPEEALFTTENQRKSRPHEFAPTDLVIGKFLGDSDLLVLNCEKGAHAEEVFVALPLDSRNDWPVVGKSFGDFLQKLLMNQGDKYWEAR